MPELENSLPEQSENIHQSEVGTSFLGKLKTKWLVILGAVGVVAIFSVLFYAVYSYSTRTPKPQPIPSPAGELTPTVAVTPFLTPTLTPTVVTSSPTVSSEGKIAFVRDGDIWSINPDGSGEEKVANILDKCVPDSELLFSPEGNKIAYLSYCGSPKVSGNVVPGGANLFVAELNTGTIKQSVFGFSSIHEFAWDSTGENFYIPEREPNPGIRLLNIEKDEFLPFVTTQEPLTGKIVIDTKNDLAYTNSWSETSRKIVSVDLLSGKVKTLILVEVGAEEIRMYGPVLNFDVSPGGTKIAYTKNDANGKSYSIYIFDINNETEKSIGALGEGAWTVSPKWSLDGSRIAYKKLGTIIKSYVMSDADGKNPKDLMDYFQTNTQSFRGIKPVYAVAGAPYSIHSLTWASDSQKVVVEASENKDFQEDPSASHELWLIDLQQNQKTKLTSNASQPAWSPR